MSSDILELNRALREGRSVEQREAEQQRTQRMGQAVGSLFSPVGGSDVLGPDVRPVYTCLLYTSPSPRDRQKSRMPSSA